MLLFLSRVLDHSSGSQSAASASSGESSQEAEAAAAVGATAKPDITQEKGRMQVQHVSVPNPMGDFKYGVKGWS